MKSKTILSFVLSFFFVGVLSAQFTFNGGTITEGKGAMTSGLDMVVSFSTPDGLLFGAQANNERSNFRFGKKFGNFSALATGGAFKNVPWIGPMFLYNYKCIDLFSWSGIGMATNKCLTNPGWKPTFFFNYQEIGLTFGKKDKFTKTGSNRLAYSFMFFATEKVNHFAIYRRTQTLSEKHAFFAEVTWHFAQEIPMFVLGYKYTHKK